MFIDIDLEEQYGEQLYQEHLEKENNQMKKDIITMNDEIERVNNIINDLEEYINPFLYMLNGITDKDEYEQAQLDTFTDITEKLQELKGSDKE